jgi:DNA-binding NarL/FixJ family response regulator
MVLFRLRAGKIIENACGKKDRINGSKKGMRIMTEAGKEINSYIGDTSPKDSSAAKLSHRQLQIISLIARGHSNSKIAEQLSLSPHTIDAYCRRILLKFGTRSRVTAAVKASQMGLISEI